MWKKIVKGIDYYIQLLGKIILKIISFIIGIIWFLIRLAWAGIKGLFGKGFHMPSWSECLGQVRRILGYNSSLGRRIAGYLAIVLLGGAILLLTVGGSSSSQNA